MEKCCFKNFDQSLFKQDVAAMPELKEIQQSRNAEEASQLLTKGLTRILDLLAPLKIIQTRSNYAPHLSERTKKLQQQREEAQKAAVESGSQEDNRVYRSLRNQALSSLRDDRTQWEKTKLSSANSPAEVWKSAKDIVGWSQSGPPSQLYIQGKHVTSTKAIASTMNRFYIDKQQKIIAGIPESATDPLIKLKERMIGREGRYAFKEVTNQDVFDIMKSIKNSTSSSINWIDNRCLKMVATEITPAITKIINLSIQTSVFPSSYKSSKLVPILKKSCNPLECNSWRPVNQVASVGKIVERALFGQMVQYLEKNSLLHPNQHGGRAGHSTTTALIQMYD